MQQQQQKAEAQQRPKQSRQQLDDIILTSPLLKALNDSGLNPVVARCMAKLGFSEPTPIQSACWGLACAGSDVLGHAEPGKLLIRVDCKLLIRVYCHLLIWVHWALCCSELTKPCSRKFRAMVLWMNQPNNTCHPKLQLSSPS